ncbi:MAG: hypothetical protein U5K00_13125 [Melioribacteraceae bacterium]|nr:hypothetical protein [Melioribacteraceae bacterium]
MNKFTFTLLIVLMTSTFYSQQAEVEVIVIDSYVANEKPYTLFLTFFTMEPVKSEVIIENEYKFTISDTLAEDHKKNIDITGIQFDSTYVEYVITGETADGKKFVSDKFEFVLPFRDMLRSDKNTSLITVCCFGGVIFGLPSAALVIEEDQNYFSLTKEIPVLSFYSGGYNYPTGYIGIEYSYIFDAEFKNFLRLGYKQLFELEPIEFISGGVNGFTTFNGFNGISPEITIGWFKVYNTFTVYSRYRFNFQPSKSDRNFHEISIGLYSNFFSINF